jgi:hypothetical protein
MFFLLQYKYGAGPALQVEALEQPGIPDSPKPNTLYLHKGKQHLVTLSVPGGKLLFLGDPLFPKTRQMPNLTLPEKGNKRALLLVLPASRRFLLRHFIRRHLPGVLPQRGRADQYLFRCLYPG